MSDLIERAREASTLKYQYHTIHVPTILIRMADEADKAAAELSALQALHAAGSAPYDAEIDRLQKRNVELTAEVAALRADGERYRAGLKYYADMNHAVFNDDAAWDTVSGEPANFWCDEAGTATVEDGTIAKLILQGWALPDDPDNEGMISPEFIDSARAKESGVVDRLTVRACRCGLKHGITVSEVCNAHCPTVYGTYCVRCGHDAACHAPKD